MIATDYVRSIEERRAKEQDALQRFPSVLYAVDRRPLPIGEDVTVEGFVIRATPDGFLVNGEPSGPRVVDAGRYGLRLSHQGHPALVLLDREATPRAASLRWYPVDPALRLRTRLEPDVARGTIASTNSPDRAAERAGWLPLVIDGRPIRLSALRLLEPGYADGHLDVYFRDATTGHGSYEVGRYLTIERDGDEVIVDFNRAYNPSCSLSPHYNCPIPPVENHLTIPIRAGEMTPRVDQDHV